MPAAALCPLLLLLLPPPRVVITQMQALQRHRSGGAAGAGQPLSTLGVAQQVFRDAGLAGFFQGLIPSLVMVVNPTIQVRMCQRVCVWVGTSAADNMLSCWQQPWDLLAERHPAVRPS